MTKKNQFLEKLREQKAEREKNPDWDKTRESWLRDLRALMQRLRTLLKSGEDEGLLRIEDTSYQLSEDGLGDYTAPGFRVRTPAGRSIEVRPHARLIVGARGRVDFVSGPNRAMLVQDDDGEWAFAVRGIGGLAKSPLTEETLSEILSDLLA